jgi:hypothetical protein
MTAQQQRLADRIIKAERKLDDLKAQYICLYGFFGLKMNEDGSVSEVDEQ